MSNVFGCRKVISTPTHTFITSSAKPQTRNGHTLKKKIKGKNVFFSLTFYYNLSLKNHIILIIKVLFGSCINYIHVIFLNKFLQLDVIYSRDIDLQNLFVIHFAEDETLADTLWGVFFSFFFSFIVYIYLDEKIEFKNLVRYEIKQCLLYIKETYLGYCLIQYVVLLIVNINTFSAQIIIY